MIILEYETQIIRNMLERSLDPQEKLSSSYEFCDFDGVRFKIVFADGVKIHMFLECFNQIAQFGVKDRFEKLYGGIKTEAASGYTLAIGFDLSKMDNKTQKETITLAARLRSNMLGAAFFWIADKMKNRQNFAPFEIPYRPKTQESIFVTPTESGAVVIFSIRFTDPGDRIIGGVFFQELASARIRIKNSPTVTYSNSPPSELKSFKLAADLQDERKFAFVSMVLAEPQLSERKIDDISFFVPMFRDYLHYHIKCTKAFLHLKMRARVAALQKVLDASKPEPKQRVRRTAKGTIMKQQ